MKIILPKNRLLKELFPAITNPSELTEEDVKNIKQAYSYGAHEPSVEEGDDYISITFDEAQLQKESAQFREVVSHCEKRNFDKALDGINELLDKNPLISDYHRIKGQIFAEKGSPQKAINELIEAVRLDPENTAALIMLGNIYSTTQGDVDTAIKFYDRVLELNPEDHLALNNIGGNLAKSGKLDEAERYFDLAHEINPKYPNTIYGQALLASRQENFRNAFDKAIEVFKYLDRQINPGLFKQSLELSQESAIEIIKNSDAENIISEYVKDLEDKSGKPIQIESSDDISTAAKIEIAEVHNRKAHLVKFKTNRIAVEHLIMHELGHLELILEAREADSNKLFTTDNKCKEAFNRDNRTYIAKSLQSRGLPEAQVESFIENIFQGLNSQIYNTPIDLFIEQRLHDRMPELRPYQYISLLKLEEDYIASAVDEDIKELVPNKIHQTNKILSLVNTIQFRELYNLDLTEQFKPTKKELNEATELYKEWIAYFNDNEPGVEYTMVELWAKDFGVENYFKLVDEEEYSAGKNDLSVVDQIEDDPLAMKNKDSVGKESFSNEGNIAGEMAATMYILDALKYFEDKSIDEIKKVGFEIGMLGRSGIDTDKPDKKYSLNSIPGKKFSGRHLLAYMYTAFQEFEPELDTGIDFEEEYEQALELFKKGH